MPNLNSLVDMLDGFSVETQEAAMKSIDIANKSVEMTTTMRTDLGAKVNRLEYNITAQESSLQNLEEAESRIMDADMAKEAAEYVRAQVMTQAGHLMMAHAMQEGERVLQLLKSG